MVDFAKLKALAEKNRGIVATDVDEVEETSERKESSNLGVGYHESCEIVAFDVGEAAANDKGETHLKGDASFIRTFVTFEKDGKQKRSFYAMPTEKLGYGANSAMNFYDNVKKLIKAAHGVNIVKENALGVIVTLLQEPALLIGSKVNIEIGYNRTSHLIFPEKGVVQINEWRPKEKVYEVLDVFFKDMDEAKAFAKREDISLGFPEITKIESAVDSCISEELAYIYELLGVIDQETQKLPAAPVETKKEEVKSKPAKKSVLDL